MRYIDEVFLHHTVTQPETTVQELREMHEARGWADVGYHYVISKASGVWTLHVGRPPAAIGAHAKGHNTNSLGVAVCGDYTRTQPPMEVLSILARLRKTIMTEYPRAAFRLHKDVSATLCPGQLYWPDPE